MAKLLIHLTHGPEAPTQADRAFLIAKTALREGHSVSMFLAGSAVSLMKDENLNKTIGIGEGVTTLRESFDEIIENGGRIVLSEVSCGARGMTESELVGKQVEFGQPKVLVELTVEHDKVITYG